MINVRLDNWGGIKDYTFVSFEYKTKVLYFEPLCSVYNIESYCDISPRYS